MSITQHNPDRCVTEDPDPMRLNTMPEHPRLPVWRSPELKGLWIYLFVLAVVFCKPLFDLVRFSLSSDLYSHMVLMPAVFVYLARLKLLELTPSAGRSLTQAIAFAAGGVGAIVVYGVLQWNGQITMADDALCLLMVSFLLFAVAGGFFFAGLDVVRAIAFPLALLIFIAPFPVAVTNGIEIFFQYNSADASYLILSLIGTPMFRDGLVFTLPGIVLEVAQECSGVRSSLVLFITSLIAGHMFLKSTWKRVVLALFVIPLAIVRNAIRIVTIALLCVHVDPEMIHSIIHKRGGPLFFALSLIPFFGLLLLLKRWNGPESAGRGHDPGND